MPILQHKPNDINTALKAMHKTICKLAHAYTKTNKSNFDDVYQNGCVGLSEAYNNFDPNAGRAFSSHAYQWIHANIRHPNSTNFNYMNSTLTKDQLEDTESYTMPLDEMIDYKAKFTNMDPTTKAIHAARAQGYTFKEISEGLTKLGTPLTLHQVRNKYLAALED